MWLLVLLLLTLPVVVQGQFYYTVTNGTITITHYNDSALDVIIPDAIDGLPVIGIGDEAFYGDNWLTSITMGTNITSIGHDAFYNCRGLTTLTMSDGVSSIGNYAFYNCSGLTNITMGNGVSSIGDYAFSDCYKLSTITMGNEVNSIGEGAFSGCGSLSSVVIPDTVTNIGDVAFTGCNWLTAVYFQGNAPNIGSYIFSGALAATIYYLPGATGYGVVFGGLIGRPMALWSLPNPLILNNPSFGIQTNRFGFSISWATNIPVVVEACTNLIIPEWSPVSTNTLTNGTSYFNDPQWTNYPGRYYRLRSP